MREPDKPRELYVEVPPPSSVGLGIDIRRDPESLWLALEEEGSIFGRLSKDSDWLFLFPGRQYVPEEDNDSGHVVLALKKNAPIDADSIKKTESDELLRHVLPLVKKGKEGEYVVGFNQARRLTGSQTSQTWYTFHAHIIRLPKKKEFYRKPTGGVRDLQEGVHHQRINRILEWYFAQELKENIDLSEGKIFEQDREDAFPRGGVSFNLKKTVAPETLSDFLKELINVYQRLHNSFSSMFINSLKPLVEVGGKCVPNLWRDEEMKHAIAFQEGRLYPPDQKKFLLRIARLLSKGNRRSVCGQNRMVDTYAYTIVIRKVRGGFK